MTFLQLCRFELLQTYRQGMQSLTPVLFFSLVCCFFPIALGHSTTLLQSIAPGVIWVSALLASLLSLSQLFQADFEDGSLELWLLNGKSLNPILASKISSHWLSTSLPLVIISPFLAGLFHLDLTQSLLLAISLLLGTPVLSLLGAMGAALNLLTNQNSLLLAIIILPFYLPVLIFGTGMVAALDLGQSLSAYFAIMGAIFLFALCFAPLATTGALRLLILEY